MSRCVDGVARVDADRVDPDSRDAACDEQRGRIGPDPRKRRQRARSAVSLGVAKIGVPAGADQHGGSGGDDAFPSFDLTDVRRGERERRIAADELLHVQAHGRPNERAERKLGGGRPVAREVHRGVEMGTGVLGQGEGARIGAVSVVVGLDHGRERRRPRPQDGVGSQRLRQVEQALGGE